MRPDPRAIHGTDRAYAAEQLAPSWATPAEARINVQPEQAQREAQQSQLIQREARSTKEQQKGCARVVQRCRPQSVLTQYRSMLGDARPIWQKALLIFPGSLLLLVMLVLSLFVEAGVAVYTAVRAIARALFRILCCKCCSPRLRRCCCVIFVLVALGGIAFGVIWLVCRDKGLETCFSGD